MNFDPHFKSLQDGRTDINIQYELLDDGKTLRRSHHNGDKMTALHLLSVMAVNSGLVVYQSCSAGKKNEIKSVQGRALNCLMLKTVVSPWMHCQKETVPTLRKQQADYVIQVKNNQKTLYEEIKAWFHKIKRDEPETISSQSYEEVDKGHGHIERPRYIRLD